MDSNGSQLAQLVDLGKRILSVDRTVAEELQDASHLTALCIPLFIAEQLCFNLWSLSATLIALKSVTLLLAMFAVHLLLQRANTPVPLGALFRAVTLAGVGDFLGVIPSLGTLLAALLWLWAFMAISAVVDELTGLGGRIVLVVSGAGCALGAVLAMALVGGVQTVWTRLTVTPREPPPDIADVVVPAPVEPAPPVATAPVAVATPPAVTKDPEPPPPTEYTAEQRRTVGNMMGTWMVDTRGTLEIADEKSRRALRSQLTLMRELTQTWREDGTVATLIGGESIPARWRVISVEGTRVSVETTPDKGERAITVVELPDPNTMLVAGEAGTIVLTRPPTSAPVQSGEFNASIFTSPVRYESAAGHSSSVEVISQSWPNGLPRIRAMKVNGLYEGNWTEYHRNGLVAEQGYYMSGKREGVWSRYDESGNRITQSMYKSGASLNTWSPNAQEKLRKVQSSR